MKFIYSMSRQFARLFFTLGLMLLSVVAHADRHPVGDVPEDILAIVNAVDRSINDRGRDDVRRPAQLLAFSKIKPGMHVFEVGAGSGYTTELLARRVGTSGRVYAQLSQHTLDNFVHDKLDKRLEKPVMSNVSVIVSDYDNALPGRLKELDAVVIVLFYHDLVWMDVDRALLNRSVFDALKPGGTYLIVDHRAAAGSGLSVAKSLHRIEESVVRSEVQAAGFVLDGDSDFLANEKDPRDQPFFKKDGPTDQFALRFRKPG